jgi:hypothetical protein
VARTLEEWKILADRKGMDIPEGFTEVREEFQPSLEDELASERNVVGEEIRLNFKEMSRCRVCTRLVTLRRLLRDGCCKCGSRMIAPVGFLFERDIREIEEEYGWDNVVIVNLPVGCVEETMFPGEVAQIGEFDIPETRLHSRIRKEKNSENDLKHGVLGVRRWFLGTPFSLFGNLGRRAVREGPEAIARG